MVTTLGDVLGHTCMNNTVWVTVVAKNSVDIVKLLRQPGFGGYRQGPVH